MPAKPPDSEDKLKRERAGTYRTADGRFTVEQTSSGWLLLDAEQADGLGLPLARGPFATLDDAREAIPSARSAPAPTAVARPARRSASASITQIPKAAGGAKAGPKAKPDANDDDRALRKTSTTPATPRRSAPKPSTPAVVVREIRAADYGALRAMWTAAGFHLLGDDDLGLARLARRNPGLVLVAAVGTRVIGSALGAWDGRRGWIYHVAVAPSHRRQGIATRLVDQIEDGLRSLGCRKVNVIVREDADGGQELWSRLGYEPGTARQYGKKLGDDSK